MKWRQVENAYAELTNPETDKIVELRHPNLNEKVIMPRVNILRKEFEDALESDFNTSLALNAFLQLVNEVNNLAVSEILSQTISNSILPEFEKMLDILGLKIPKITEEEKSTVNELIKNRNMFREQKQYQEADKIRKQISEMGITLIDHKNRTLWMKQEKIGIES
ncbi:MAG: DALR domain-containing protein [Nitrosopumilaceae archaeon]